MGQFEIKGTKTMELIPDTISLIVDTTVVSKGVLSKDKHIEEAKSKLKDTVTKLAYDLKDTTKDCSVSFSDLVYSECPITNMFEQPSKSFGIGHKKQDIQVDVKASTVMTIKLTTRDETILSNILKLLLNSTVITNISEEISVTDIEDKYTELKSEVCKKCRKDADTIVTNLGSSITGVEKVIYNSSGSLLDSQSNKTAKTNKFQASSSFEFETDSLFDCDDADLGDLDIQIYDDVWANGFVQTILDRKYTISDSVTVVFNIK